MDSATFFPLYRRAASGMSFYRVEAPDRLVEIQVVGSRYMIHTLEARILPERQLIRDIIDQLDGAYVEVTPSEYDAFEADCRNNRSRIA